MDAQPVSTTRRVLTVGPRRGLVMRPFVWPPEPGPFVDESLLGLVVRTASRNAHVEMKQVLALADIQTYYPAGLPVVHVGSEDNLAFLLKVSPKDVGSRMHAAVPQLTRKKKFIDFFGTPLLSMYRETGIRRYSARSLRNAPYHRASWDLRPLQFCPDSRELLQSKCPSCERPLRWFRTRGIVHCEFCVADNGKPTVDLRDKTMPFVEVSDDAALTFATDLIHPDPERRCRAGRSLSPVFSAFSPGDLFLTVVTASCAITADPSNRRPVIPKFKSLGEYEKISADVLARAARILMTWPKAFCDLADEMRETAHLRTGLSGLAKELGPLRVLAWDRSLPEGIRAIMRSGNMAAMVRPSKDGTSTLRYRSEVMAEGFITQKSASRRLGVGLGSMNRLATLDELTIIRTGTTKGSSVLYKASEIDELVKVRTNLVSARGVSSALGIPLSAVDDVADRGYLTKEFGPASVLGVSTSVFYRKSSLDALLARLCTGIQRVSAVRSDPPALITSAGRLSLATFPWGETIDAIVDGRLALFRRSSVEKGRFTYDYGVLDPSPLLEITKGYAPAIELDVAMTHEEAAMVIGTTAQGIRRLVAGGLLAETGQRCRGISGAKAREFKTKYIFLLELSKRLGMHPSRVRPFLSSVGVEHIWHHGTGSHFTWERSAVRSFFTAL